MSEKSRFIDQNQWIKIIDISSLVEDSEIVEWWRIMLKSCSILIEIDLEVP